MRRRRPGVTAAATTAVFATGCPPGLATAAPTTAALATGARTTPTRPTRAARNISCSSRLEGVIGLERGDDRLDRDAPVGDQLAARAPGGGCEGRGPEVLVHEDPGDASRAHRHGELLDIVGGEQLRELAFDRHQVPEVAEISQLHGVHRARLVLG